MTVRAEKTSSSLDACEEVLRRHQLFQRKRADM